METKIFSSMLLLTVNNSIGNKKNHFDENQLVELFNKNAEDYKNAEKYAVDIIQSEAIKKEIVYFCEKYNISKSRMDYLLQSNPIWSEQK